MVRSICGGRSEGRSAPVTSRYTDRSVCDVLRTGSYDRTIRTFERTLTRRYCVPSVVCIRIVREPLTQRSLEYRSLIGKRIARRMIQARHRRWAIAKLDRDPFVGASSTECDWLITLRRYTAISCWKTKSGRTREIRPWGKFPENNRHLRPGLSRSQPALQKIDTALARVRASIHSERRGFNAARRSPREIRSRECIRRLC
jgi:hypothetical protein